MFGFYPFSTMQGTTGSAGTFNPSASLCSFLNVWWGLTGILEKMERPPRHTLSTFEFTANRQQQSLLCCLIQNHIDLCFLLVHIPQPTHTHMHTHTQPHTHQPNILPHRQHSQKIAFKTLYGCQAHAENYSQGILLLNTNRSRLWKWGITRVLNGEQRYGLEKWHRVLAYQFQWLKEKHLADLDSKKHKWS